MTNGGCFRSSVIKEPDMALLGAEDVEFSSSEDYLENEIHSPTDTSEDSVEVKVSAISLVNKRKHLDSVKGHGNFTGPLKKRMCLKVKTEINGAHPFRPWSPSPKIIKNDGVISNLNTFVSDNRVKIEETFSVPLPQEMCQTTLEPQFTYFRPPSPIRPYQSEPVSLVKKRDNNQANLKTESEKFQDIRVPVHPEIQSLSTAETERMILKTNEIFPTLQNNSASNVNDRKTNETHQRREQRNYKNMTRERRIEANARERTRVHTISAAFDTLRRSIPAYSHNQKLSKLSVLRIACSYIMTLSSLVTDSPNEEEPSTSECVDMVSKTIQREGKLRKKKDDND